MVGLDSGKNFSIDARTWEADCVQEEERGNVKYGTDASTLVDSDLVESVGEPDKRSHDEERHQQV